VNKKTYKYDPKKISLIIIIGFILLIVFVNKEYKASIRYAVMTCTSNFGAPEHKETVTFKFLAKKDGILYDFSRNETYHYESDEDVDKVFDNLVEFRNSIKSMIDSTNVIYDIKKKDKDINVYTYIKVGERADLFNDYAKELKLTKSSTAKEVYETMTVNDAYTCIETETK